MCCTHLRIITTVIEQTDIGEIRFSVSFCETFLSHASDLLDSNSIIDLAGRSDFQQKLRRFPRKRDLGVDFRPESPGSFYSSSHTKSMEDHLINGKGLKQ
jgi:hypothetical protein